MPTLKFAGLHAAAPLDGDWSIGSLSPDHATEPKSLDAAGIAWMPLPGPVPVARALTLGSALGDGADPEIEGKDWWYRCRFRAPGPGSIRFDGLATLAEVWIDGETVLTSESMFARVRVPLGESGPHDRVLHIRFASIERWLARKRPRPAWKTRLVEHQQLRWLRTSLLGRIPSWCPPLPIVGPWREVWFEPAAPITAVGHRIRPSVEGTEGHVEVRLTVTSPGRPSGTVRVGETTAPLTAEPSGETWTLTATAIVPEVGLWWPHTHGEQPLYPVTANIAAGQSAAELDLGRVGFRTLHVDHGTDGRGFGLRINGVDIFCRGSCWSPPDLASGATVDALPEAMEQARAAGMNMIRVGGTMVYESDAFHDACDALGILVWQDLMFANMDYPAADARFAESARIEAETLFDRLQGRPSVAVICGSSEVEQQAAMLGLGPERWTNSWFNERLPDLCRDWLPDAAYVRSSPTGGALPFHTDQGISHYYGVGAYRRPLTDARLANVRFAAECLAFSNIPEPNAVDRLLGDGERAPHHPKWKAGVPRDPGAGWDFEDVRDHYVETLFRITAAELRDLRSVDPDRYLELGRVATGEVIARTIGEWRRPGSPCRGALVWFHRDLRPGAGWGLVDNGGNPKAAYWYFRRAARPVTLSLGDEGLNGLAINIMNDETARLAAILRVTVYREGRTVLATAARSIEIPPRSSGTWMADDLLGGFRDLTGAYRFGPPAHDVVVASLLDPEGRPIMTECFWPFGLPTGSAPGVRLTATPEADGNSLTLETDTVVSGVAIRILGAAPEANYLSLEPGTPVRVPWRRTAGATVRGQVMALNANAVAVGPC